MKGGENDKFRKIDGKYLYVEQVTHFFLLGPKVIFGGMNGRDDAGDPLRNGDSRFFERGDLLGIVRHQAHGAQAKITEDRTRQRIAPEIRFKTELFVGLHGIGTVVLKFVGAELIHQADAAAFLVFVNQEASTFGGDGFECEFELGAAIASQAVENVAGQALGMDADERRGAIDVPHFKDDGFLYHAIGVAFKAVDAEVSKAAGKIGFSYFSEFKCWGHGISSL